MDEKRLSVFELAERVGVHPRTIRVWARRGKLPPPMRIGGRLYWLQTDYDAWLARSKRNRQGRAV